MGDTPHASTGSSITRETYDQLVDAFRQEPGNIEHARITVGVSWPTAKKAWARGWPRQLWQPISQVIETEQRTQRVKRFEAELAAEKASILGQAETAAIARVQAAENQANERVAQVLQRAKIDAVDQQADEAMICKAARKNAVTAQALTARILQQAREVVDAVMDPAQVQASKHWSPHQKASFVSVLARLQREVNMAAKLAIEVERIRVGDPTSVVEVKIDPTSLEAAVADIQHAAEMVALGQRRGALPVLPAANQPGAPKAPGDGDPPPN